MKMDLIQPFINSLDAVIAETMGCSAEIADVTMEEGNYKRTGIAALVGITGEIEGRVILIVAVSSWTWTRQRHSRRLPILAVPPANRQMKRRARRSANSPTW